LIEEAQRVREENQSQGREKVRKKAVQLGRDPEERIRNLGEGRNIWECRRKKRSRVFSKKSRKTRGVHQGGTKKNLARARKTKEEKASHWEYRWRLLFPLK